jgi:catechol 2,3-dioxygenase-like lactoylglutathione lyase family enzyme
LVDTLVARSYLERQIDPQDRRRYIVSLTERGRDAARIQTKAREGIDLSLTARIGRAGLVGLRKLLAALIGVGLETQSDREANSARTLQVKGVTPILFVSDVTLAAQFYMDLGFSTDFLYGTPPFYGSVSRDGACLHLRYVAHPNFAELAATEEALILATVEVSDIHALHAEFDSRGVHISRGLVDQPWGGTDFHVRDPSGNEISFVQYHQTEPTNGGT